MDSQSLVIFILLPLVVIVLGVTFSHHPARSQEAVQADVMLAIQLAAIGPFGGEQRFTVKF